MKNLAVAAIILSIVYVCPLDEQPGPAHDLWALGLLVLAAYMMQRLGSALAVPQVVAWVVGGILVGHAGLRLLPVQGDSALPVVEAMAAVAVGLHVALYLSLPSGFGWRGCCMVLVVTVTTVGVTTLGLTAVAELPWWLALLLGSLAGTWGPFSTMPRTGRRGVILLSSIGAGFGVLLLTGTVGLLYARGLLSGDVPGWLLRLWTSLVAGIVGGEALQRSGLLSGRTSFLAAVLGGLLLLSALVLHYLGLFALAYGFGAGLALVSKQESAKRVRLLLRSASPLPLLLLVAVIGASLNLRALWPGRPDVMRIVLVQVLVVAIARVAGPALFPPFAVPHSDMGRYMRWSLLPHGVLLYDLVLHPRHGLLQLLRTGADSLLEQVVMVDVLLGIAALCVIAGPLESRMRLTRLAAALAPAQRDRTPTAEHAPRE